jgi:hypothetical protein
MSIDLTGSIHGKLQVISQASRENDRRTLYKCLCLICNNIYTMRPSQLKLNTFGCGRCSKIERGKPKRAEHIGKIYGMLKILDFSEESSLQYKVQCTRCSKVYTIRHDHALKNIHGCAGCHHQPGPSSYFWKGGEHIPGRLFSNFKYGAKKRDIDWDLTIKDLDALWEKQNGRCAYTNRELTLSIDNCTASLDRIDSSRGYFVDNVQFVHKMINTMKWDFKEQDFLDAIKEIYEFKVNA